MIDKRPVLIASCHDAADVTAAVDFARRNGLDLDLAVRGGATTAPASPALSAASSSTSRR